MKEIDGNLFRVHIIVCCTFHGFKNYADGWTVEHKKGRKLKYPNDKSNLKWLPNSNEKAAEVGLQTNQGAYRSQPAVKRAQPEVSGKPIWTRSKVEGGEWSEWKRWPSKNQFFEKGGLFRSHCKAMCKVLKVMIKKGETRTNAQGTTFEATDADPSL